jgi:hypothetical protein
MSDTIWPWQQYGGSFVWPDERQVNGRVTLPRRCCADSQPELTGDCGKGCCEDYRCKSCGRTWRYEYPD